MNARTVPGAAQRRQVDQLGARQSATIIGLHAPAGLRGGIGITTRLAELGFLPGEQVTLLRRGPGGREPLAVLVGDTVFALRALEAACIEVTPDTASRRA